ncbi:exodeoxyribonuclease V subunit gamma, partial [Salmonella enterica subsp. enterica serovar Lubbock]
ENEVFLVQSNGMAQWLRLRFAADDGGGIAAALEMQMPSRFLWQAYRAVLGDAEVPQDSPLDKARLSWRLLRLLPGCLTDERFVALRHYLAEPADVSKRFQLAERLADLFDQYQVYRADWLEDWGQGRDVLRDAFGQPRPVPDKL